MATVLLLSAAAIAQAPLSETVPPDWKAEGAPVAPTALESLAADNPACTEFRNSCIVCVRSEKGGLGCSNIGIACQPDTSWRCTSPGLRDLAPK